MALVSETNEVDSPPLVGLCVFRSVAELIDLARDNPSTLTVDLSPIATKGSRDRNHMRERLLKHERVAVIN
jgi:hypothetical protein